MHKLTGMTSLEGRGTMYEVEKTCEVRADDMLKTLN